MDYLPPIVVQESLFQVADREGERLVIAVERAVYDAEAQQAEIAMGEAFQKSHAIEFYRGDVITLVYRDEAANLDGCPVVSVPVEDISRDVDYRANVVTLKISNIPKSLAESIERNLCLFIDTDTVKKVANPDFMSAEEVARKKKRGGFFNL